MKSLLKENIIFIILLLISIGSLFFIRGSENSIWYIQIWFVCIFALFSFREFMLIKSKKSNLRIIYNKYKANETKQNY